MVSRSRRRGCLPDRPAAAEELARLKLTPVPVPTHMSVDEVAWKKWHRYVTNVVDIDERKVIWNHDGRGKSVLGAFYEELGAEHCATIQAVDSDGASGFLSATKKHAKNVLIVLDHFHVKKYLNDAVDTVRKQELSKARKAEHAELVSLRMQKIISSLLLAPHSVMRLT